MYPTVTKFTLKEWSSQSPLGAPCWTTTYLLRKSKRTQTTVFAASLSLLPAACLKGCQQQVLIRTCVNLTTLFGFWWHLPRIWTSFSIFFWGLVFSYWFSNCCHFRTDQWKGVVSHLSCMWHSWRIWCCILFGHIPKCVVGQYWILKSQSAPLQSLSTWVSFWHRGWCCSCLWLFGIITCEDSGDQLYFCVTSRLLC